MPFKSKAQERYMFSQHPMIARRWEKKYDTPKNLPEKVKDVLKSRSKKSR